MGTEDQLRVIILPKEDDVLMADVPDDGEIIVMLVGRKDWLLEFVSALAIETEGDLTPDSL